MKRKCSLGKGFWASVTSILWERLFPRPGELGDALASVKACLLNSFVFDVPCFAAL